MGFDVARGHSCYPLGQLSTLLVPENRSKSAPAQASAILSWPRVAASKSYEIHYDVCIRQILLSRLFLRRSPVKRLLWRLVVLFIAHFSGCNNGGRYLPTPRCLPHISTISTTIQSHSLLVIPLMYLTNQVSLPGHMTFLHPLPWLVTLLASITDHKYEYLQVVIVVAVFVCCLAT